jgi:hypothetical protein
LRFLLTRLVGATEESVVVAGIFVKDAIAADRKTDRKKVDRKR